MWPRWCYPINSSEAARFARELFSEITVSGNLIWNQPKTDRLLAVVGDRAAGPPVAQTGAVDIFEMPISFE